MAEWVTNTMETLGYWGIVLLMFLENIVPPIPSEVVMPAAGFAARKGEMNIFGVVLAGTAGALLGAVPWYYVARWLGGERLRQIVSRYGRWFGLKNKDIDKAEQWFDRHGRKAVFFGRLIPGVRTLISIPAGLTRMPFVTFFLYSLAGTAIWTAFLAWLGWVLRGNYHVVEKYIGPISKIALGIIVIAAIVWIVRHRRAMKREGTESGAAE